MIDEDDVVTGEFPAVELQLDDDGNPIIPKVTDEWMWAMQRAVTKMQKSAAFHVEHEDWFRPVPAIVKETVQSAAGMVAAPTIASLYDLSDGYEMEWSHAEDGEFVPAGCIHLYGFAEVFGNWLHKLWGEHPEDATELEQDFTWEIRAFDAAQPDNPYQVVMHTPEMLPTYNLYWHAPNGPTYPLTVDFMGYLECLTKTCGMYGWQWLVCDIEDDDTEALEHVRAATERLQALFPEVEPSSLGNREDDAESASEEE